METSKCAVWKLLLQIQLATPDQIDVLCLAIQNIPGAFRFHMNHQFLWKVSALQPNTSRFVSVLCIFIYNLKNSNKKVISCEQCKIHFQLNQPPKVPELLWALKLLCFNRANSVTYARPERKGRRPFSRRAVKILKATRRAEPVNINLVQNEVRDVVIL